MGVVLAATLSALVSAHGADSAAPPAHAARQAHCLKALAPITADSIPNSTDFVPADCGSDRIADVFRYDRANGSTRLARAVAANEIVPTYPEYGMDVVRPGQMLELVVNAGPARIEREVEALQPARSGQGLFVKSSDGQIISVRYEGGAP